MGRRSRCRANFPPSGSPPRHYRGRSGGWSAPDRSARRRTPSNLAGATPPGGHAGTRASRERSRRSRGSSRGADTRTSTSYRCRSGRRGRCRAPAPLAPRRWVLALALAWQAWPARGHHPPWRHSRARKAERIRRPGGPRWLNFSSRSLFLLAQALMLSRCRAARGFSVWLANLRTKCRWGNVLGRTSCRGATVAGRRGAAAPPSVGAVPHVGCGPPGAWLGVRVLF